jgi:biopolymer transport protein ExbD
MATEPTTNRGVISAINVTPFVDIALVLLVIFMVTASTIAKGSFEVELPKAATAGAAVPDTLNLVVDAQGAVHLDGAAVADADVTDAVRRRAGGDPKAQAVIAADRTVDYGIVIAVIDRVKAAGITSFALNIERGSP